MSDPRRVLPSVPEVMDHASLQESIRAHGRNRVLDDVRHALGDQRRALRESGADITRETALRSVLEAVRQVLSDAESSQPSGVINATGVVLHTGLGRAPLSDLARKAISEQSWSTNLEVDLLTGERSGRGASVVEELCHLTGAEAGLIVNNNAAATLLVLSALGCSKEVVISRGQLVEIGGSYRLPEIFNASGARLREVGTTNRTRTSDYESAIDEETAAILRVHPSNFRVVGFTESPGIGDLVALAQAHGLPCIDDIGSGALVDLSPIGLHDEPTFQESIAAGADLVLGSGDKLLGGPQSGIILGKAELVQRLKASPLARALRVDKLTLAALCATVDSYKRGNAWEEIPTLRMLAEPVDVLRQRAKAVQDSVPSEELCELTIAEDHAPVGGGSLPGMTLPTVTLQLRHTHATPDEFARALRLGSRSVFPRIADDAVIIDFRSIPIADQNAISEALREAIVNVAERAVS